MTDWVQKYMAQQRQEQAEKGGSGSGHHDHAGRPGQVGGSAPGEGGDRQGGTTGAAGSEKRVRNGLLYKHPDTGLAVEEKDWYGYEFQDKEAFTFFGNVVNKQGEKVGMVERKYLPGDSEVQHIYFKIEPEYQGAGFGTTYYRNCEAEYIKNGVERVTMTANMNVGGYAWARVGFDFAKDTERKAVAGKLAGAYAAKYGGDRQQYVGAFEKLHAWDMAALTGPDGGRIGKSVMLGTEWAAIKLLSATAPHRSVGDSYYAEKDKRKKR